MSLEQKSEPQEQRILQNTFNLLRTATDKAIALARCEPVRNHAMGEIRDANLTTLKTAMEQAITDANLVVQSLPRTAVQAIEKDLITLCIPQRLEATTADGVKERILKVLGDAIDSLPIPPLVKLLLKLLIAVIQAVQGDSNSSSQIGKVLV